MHAAVGEKMRALLVAMKKGHPGQDEGLKTCWQTLLKMCGNVYNNPGEPGCCAMPDRLSGCATRFRYTE